jgi:hypothetical protein
MSRFPTQQLAVILEREAVQSRWETHRWQLGGVLPDEGGEPRTLLETDNLLRRLYPGFEVSLFPEEAEGYYLNISTEEPSVFVSIRHHEESGERYPFQVTVNYTEAARWMDGGELVERTPMWRELAEWIADWVAANYRPEPKKRRKPQSFEGKEGILREKGSSR